MRDKSLQIVSLSKRLESIVELAGHGDTLCDVGCDHAHVPIRLLQNGQFRKAIGMDVIEGPLGKARGNLELYGMTDDVELRLSDGLDAFQEGEADTLVVTGMGGTLMRGILLREPDKTRSFNALVLGPQSDPDKVRAAVRELGFSLEDERLIYEDGKYYPVLRAVVAAQHSIDPQQRREPDLQGSRSAGPALFPPEIPEKLCREAEDLFGPVLLRRRDPVLREFLVRRIAVLEKIMNSVSLAAEGQRTKEKAGDFPPPTGQKVFGLTREEEESEESLMEEDNRLQDKRQSEKRQSEKRQPGKEHSDKEYPEKKHLEKKRLEKKHLEKKHLEKKHLEKKSEIEHSLEVYRAALRVFLQMEAIAGK